MTILGRPYSLRTLLKLDGATCLAMGLLLMIASTTVGGLTEIPGPLLFWAGVLLMPTAALMLGSALVKPVPKVLVAIVVAGNLAWVVASLALPLGGWIVPNLLGWIFLIAQAAVVAVFAAAEWSALAGRALAAT